jgi:hypothetical protein
MNRAGAARRGEAPFGAIVPARARRGGLRRRPRREGFTTGRKGRRGRPGEGE